MVYINKYIKRILKVLLFSFSVILFTSFNTEKAHASWTNDALDFYNEVGENKAKYNIENDKGYFYFGQRGTTRSSNANYYRIIGFGFSVTSPSGVTYSAGMNIPDNVSNSYTEQSEGKTYDLWKVPLDKMVMRLKTANPGVNFSFIYDGSKGDTDVTFNAIVIMYNFNGDNKGNINSDGSWAWGDVIRSWSDPFWTLTLADGSKWTPKVDERRALYGIIGKIPSGSMPSIMSNSGSINKKSSTSVTLKAHYDNGSTRWVNAKDPFSISSTSTLLDGPLEDYGAPDGANLDLVRFEDAVTNTKSDSIFSHTRTANSISLASTSNFTLHSAKGAVAVSGRKLNSTVHVKANEGSDGSTYILKVRSNLNRAGLSYNSIYVTATDGATAQVLRVDARPPDTSNGANDLTATVSGNTVTLKAINLRDITNHNAEGKNTHTGSGIASVWANIVNSANTTIGVNMPRSGGTATASYNMTGFGANPDGKYTVKFYALDNVGNQRHLGDKAIEIKNNTPEYATTTSISNYNYRNDSTKVFWYRGDTAVFVDLASTVKNATPNFHALFVKDGTTDLFHADMYTNKYQSHNSTLNNGGDADRRMTVTGTTTKTAKSTFVFMPNGNVDQKVGVVSGAIYQDANNVGPYYTDAYKVGFDLQAPTYTSTSAKFDSSNNNIELQIFGVADKGSGLDNGVGKTKYKVYPTGGTEPSGWSTMQAATGNMLNGFDVTVYGNHQNYAKWTVKVVLVDRVGNTTTVTKENIQRNAVITNKSVLIQNHEYTDETGKIKWVQHGNNFNVTHQGLGRYLPPTGSQIRFSLTNVSTDKGWRSTRSSGSTWTQPDNFAGMARTSGDQPVTISGIDSTGYYTIKSVNELSATSVLHNKIYYVSGMTERSVNNVMMAAPTWIFETYRLGIDAEAPANKTISGKFDANNMNIDVTITGLDDSGSGLKTTANATQYKVYPTGQTEPSAWSTTTVAKGDNTKKFSVTGYTGHLKHVTWTVKVRVYDNVGNYTDIIKNDIKKPFELKSTSVTINDYEYKNDTTKIKWVKADNDFKLDYVGTISPLPAIGSQFLLFSGSDFTKSADYVHVLTTVVKYTPADNLVKYIEPNDTLNKLYVQPTDPASGTTTYPVNNTGYFKSTSAGHGKIFYAGGKSEYKPDASANEGLLVSNIVTDAYRLGIDAVAPTYNLVKTHRDKVTITFADAHSGFKSATIKRIDGTTQAFTTVGPHVVNLNGSNSLDITRLDNVGNTATETRTNLLTTVASTLTSSVVTQNNRKYLKIDSTMIVTNPVPNVSLDYAVTGTGDGVTYVDTTNQIIKKKTDATGGTVSFNTSFLVDDTYNTPNKTSVTYFTDQAFSSKLDWTALADIIKNYTFQNKTKYANETAYVQHQAITPTFNSAYKNFKYTVQRLTDEDLNTITPVNIHTNVVNTSRNISLNNQPSGKYKVFITMYDFNGNPSGTAEKEFMHLRPLTFEPRDLNVTAVKDIAWEKAVYPIAYDGTKFPLGKNYKFESNDINMGYMVNFNYRLPDLLDITAKKVKYRFYAQDGSELTGYVDSKTFAQADTADGTHYASQIAPTVEAGELMYMKHFVPATAKFKKSNGTAYNGLVDVKMTFDFTVNGLLVTETTSLYTVNTEDTAIDDLTIDKQR